MEDKLVKLEAAAQRAQRLAQLPANPGWEELRMMALEQLQLYDEQILRLARADTLTEREIHRYADTTKAIKVFLGRPEQAQKKLDTLLRKVQQAQPDEGDE